MLSQAHSMLERQRSYDSGRMAFLTLFDPHVEKPELHHEHRNLLLRRPRITIICRPGTTLAQIKATFKECGWSEATYDAWFERNGQVLIPRGFAISDDLPVTPSGRGEEWSPTIR